MRIDSHHHFWNYSASEYAWIDAQMEVLQRDFRPEHLRLEIERAGIAGVVSVQARQTIEETDWLLGVAEQHDWIRGVVGWLPLASPELDQALERRQHCQALKGVRHVVQSEPDEEFILGADFNRGLALLPQFDLVYDILIFARQLGPAIRCVDRHPNLRFVLDHIAKPTIDAEFDDRWGIHIRELAKRDNVTCKFSGVVTEVRDPAWSLTTVKPYWDAALEAFGPQRLMFGSDWPVSLLRCSYMDWVSTVEKLAAQLSDDERTALWGGTATRVYQL